MRQEALWRRKRNTLSDRAKQSKAPTTDIIGLPHALIRLVPAESATLHSSIARIHVSVDDSQERGVQNIRKGIPDHLAIGMVQIVHLHRAHSASGDEPRDGALDASWVGPVPVW